MSLAYSLSSYQSIALQSQVFGARLFNRDFPLGAALVFFERCPQTHSLSLQTLLEKLSQTWV